MTEAALPAAAAQPDPAVPSPPPPTAVAQRPARRRPVGLIVATCLLGAAVLAVGVLAGLKAAKVADLNAQVTKLQSENASQQTKVTDAHSTTSRLNARLAAATSASKQTSTAVAACGAAAREYSIFWKEAQYGAVTQSQVANALATARAACSPLGVVVNTPS